jgi:hypothetical protein
MVATEGGPAPIQLVQVVHRKYTETQRKTEEETTGLKRRRKIK